MRMRPELMQLSLVKGPARGARGATGSWTGSRRWSTAWRSSGSWARSKWGRRGGVKWLMLGLRGCCSGAVHVWPPGRLAAGCGLCARKPNEPEHPAWINELAVQNAFISQHYATDRAGADGRGRRARRQVHHRGGRIQLAAASGPSSIWRGSGSRVQPKQHRSGDGRTRIPRRSGGRLPRRAGYGKAMPAPAPAGRGAWPRRAGRESRHLR